MSADSSESCFFFRKAALIGTGLCWWLIPSHGLTGAAIATTIAVAYNIGISVLELYSLERMWVPLAELKAPHLALGIMAVALALFWDPAALPALWMRAAFAAGSLLLYIALLYVTGHPEVRAWRAWRARGQDR